MPLRRFSKGMLQRVGIAQALVNDPEVVFFDEPMSGLDPLGRREVRNLILRLRDQGTTLFFSSHVLSDAEALCSRVAILTGGKLVASGTMAEIHAFEVRGWELVVSGVSPALLQSLAGRVTRVTSISEGRYALDIPLETAPERLLDELIRRGAHARLVEPDALHTRGLLRRAGDARSAHTIGGRMSRVIPLIAVNVFKESVRDRVLYNLVFFAVLLIGTSYLIGQLTAGQDIKIIKDLGLAATSVFGLFIAVFIGIGLVSKEVERRSIYALLSKPIRRHEFIVGKYLGLVLTLLINVSVMTVAVYAVLAGMAWLDGAWMTPERPAIDPLLLKAILLIFLQLMIVTAIALFFSTFSSPMLSAALTFGVYVVGHFNADLKHFESVIDSKPGVYLARAMYYLLPNLAPLDVKAQVVHGQPVPWSYIGLNTLYALVYVLALVLAAMFIFSRRDFK